MSEPRSTRARLLDAALDAFARGGYAGASIRSITRAVGVRESAFYAHFASKRAAFDELMTEAGPAVVVRLVRALPDDVAPAQAMASLVTSALDAWASPRARAFAAIVLREAVATGGDMRAALLGGIDEAVAALSERFARWQRDEVVSASTPPAVLAYELMAPVVLTRFLYFSHAASDDEMRRGRQMVEAHARSFAVLCRSR